MTRNENQLTSLPFYTAEKYQNRFKEWVRNKYRLNSPNDRFLPFQIIKGITEVGGTTCPIPSSISYTGDFSTLTDGWSLDTSYLPGGGSMTVEGGKLKIVVNAGNLDGAVVINRKLTATDYAYNATTVAATVDSVGPVDLYAYGFVNCSKLYSFPRPDIANGYTISESCTGNTTNDRLSFTFVPRTTSAVTIYVETFTITATPYQLFIDDPVYESDFSSGVDGWSIDGSSAAAIDTLSGNLRITWNGETSVSLKQSVVYSNDNIRRIMWSVGVPTPGYQTLRLNSFTIIGVNTSDDPVYRVVSVAHSFANGAYTYDASNTDNLKEISEIRLNFGNLGDSTNTVENIDFSVQYLCTESQNDLWADAAIVNADTAAEVDVTAYMNANTETSDFSDYQVAIYKGGTALGFTNAPGYYYLRLNDGVDIFYSEVFLACNDLSQLLKVEWWKDTNLNFATGSIVYTSGYINTMYLEAEIGKSNYEFTIDQTVRSGYKFIEKAVSVKQFEIKNLLVPQFVVDVLSRLVHHEYILITKNDIDYQLTDVELGKPDWEDEGDLAEWNIIFETDTIISSGGEISTNVNELLGNATDAINIRGNNKRIYQLNDIIDGILDDLYLAADKSTNSEAVRIPLSAITQAANQESATLSTSIYYGGELSINADTSKFDIEAGKAIFVDNFTDPENPAVVFVAWARQVGLSVTNIATQLVTYVTLDSAGDFGQQAAGITTSEARTLLEIGVLVHTDGVSIEKTTTLSNWNKDTDLKTLDLANSIGRVNVTGNEFSPDGASLKINRSAGTMFAINGNRAINTQNPNIVSSSVDTKVLTYRVYGGTPSVLGTSTNIDTTNYDPNGAGTLVVMPAEAVTVCLIFYSPETNITAVHYGQHIYDSLYDAVESWDKENYVIAQELKDIPVRCALAFVAGATALNDPLQAIFINTGEFGVKNLAKIEQYSRYSSDSKTLSGMTYKKQKTYIVAVAGVIYLEVERLGGGDMVYIFGEREYTLNCTTGAGTGGRARVALTAGSATTPQKNYVYVTKVPGTNTAQLLASVGRPTGEFAYVTDCMVQDVTTFTSQGPQEHREWTDAKEFDGRGTTARTNERIRVLPAEYDSGLAQSVTITINPSTPDNVIFSCSGGQAWQKHLQSFPARNISTDGIYIVNHPTTPYLKISDLNSPEALQTADGTSLEGARFNWVIWGVQNANETDCKLYLNLPVGSYGADTLAISDPDNLAVTSIPIGFRGTGILIARMPMRHKTTAGGTYENLADALLSQPVIDLRGVYANVSAGAVSVPAATEFEDTLLRIFNLASGFGFKFSAVNLTTERVFTLPDADGTISLSDENVKISATDTTAGKFNDKLAVGGEFEKVIENQGGNENILLKFKGWIFNAARTFKAVFDVSALTADRTFTLPDFAGLIAVYGNVTAFLFGGQVRGGSKIVTFSATPTFNLNEGNSQQITLTANITSWTLSNALAGSSYILYFKQDATGGWSIPDCSVGTKTKNSGTFATAPNDENIVNVIVKPDGTIYWSVVDGVV